MELDSIPWPDYDLLGLPAILNRQSPTDSYYFSTLKNKPRVIDMITSRSCPFSCTFVFIQLEKFIEKRSLDSFLVN